MSVLITLCLEVKLFIKCILQINSSLVCQAKHYKYHICQLLTQVFILIAFFLTLLAVATVLKNIFVRIISRVKKTNRLIVVLYHDCNQ